MFYKKESIEELKQVVDPKEVLISIGGVSPALMTDNGFEIRCPCPLHSGDNPTGFSWKRSEGMWTCFTKECGKDGPRDVYAFVMNKLNVEFKEAVETLSTMFGFDLQTGDSEGYSDYLAAAEVRKDYTAMKNTRLESLKVLTTFPGYYEEGYNYVEKYLESRNYTDEDTISTFQFYPCLDNYNILRMGIPAFDEFGNLVGVNARRMDGVLNYPEVVINSLGKEKKIAKYDMVANFKKGGVLFNLNRAKNNLVNDSLIVVEGELSAIRMYSYGFKNVVASRGSNLTNNQARLLYKYCCNVVFLVESGEAAEKGVINSLEKLPGMKISIARLESGDPDDNSKEQITKCLSNLRVYQNTEVEKCVEYGKLL